MKYLELHFKISPYDRDMADLLTGVAAEAGLESFTEDEQSIKGYVREDAFDAGRLEDNLSMFEAMNVRVTYTLKAVEDRNWNEEWERTGFRPVLLAGRVLVHNGSYGDLPPAEYNILIDPHQAFGTGSHQTTGLIVERLLGMDLDGLQVLDAGCGTGILGIFCAMKGAAGVYAYDIDSWSVRNTVQNAGLNRVGCLRVEEGDASLLAGKTGFDLVLANINRNILLADMPAFAACLKKGGRLILSGFYTEDIPLMQVKAASVGLKFVDSTVKDNWVSLLFQS